jgi:hypothetical protein
MDIAAKFYLKQGFYSDIFNCHPKIFIHGMKPEVLICFKFILTNLIELFIQYNIITINLNYSLPILYQQ